MYSRKTGAPLRLSPDVTAWNCFGMPRTSMSRNVEPLGVPRSLETPTVVCLVWPGLALDQDEAPPRCGRTRSTSQPKGYL